MARLMGRWRRQRAVTPRCRARPWYRIAGNRQAREREGWTVSNGIGLILAIVLAFALVASLFVLVYVIRRSSPDRIAAQNAAAQGASAEQASQRSSAATQTQLDEAVRQAEQVRARAESDAAAIVQKAEVAAEQVAQGRREVEDEIRAVKDEVRQLRGDLERRETRLAEREQRVDEEARRVDQRSAELDQVKQDLDARDKELSRLEDERRDMLQRVAGLTAEQAKTELVAGIENQAKREAALIVRDIENEARVDGQNRARKIVTLAIQRVASEQTSESVVSVLHLPGDEMKGRIIGREGRNIRAFETVTGVNLIIDDTPVDLAITDLHPELTNLLGRLRYRTSYGQNVLKHLVESAHIAGMMASELGMDAALMKRCTVLHDIGKALTHEVQGSHALIGAEIARRYGEPEDVVHAIEAHHNEVEVRTVEAVLTQAADAMSGGRPGAWSAWSRSPAGTKAWKRSSRCRPAGRSG